jgi:hypothetical protein
MKASDDASIQQGCADLRRRRRWLAVAILGLLPIGPLSVQVARWSGGESSPNVPWLLLAYGVLLAIAATRVAFARCPRCHGYFHQHRYIRHPWTGKCLHCGLSLAA